MKKNNKKANIKLVWFRLQSEPLQSSKKARLDHEDNRDDGLEGGPDLAEMLKSFVDAPKDDWPMWLEL